jgi:hypothetical protein
MVVRYVQETADHVIAWDGMRLIQLVKECIGFVH